MAAAEELIAENLQALFRPATRSCDHRAGNGENLRRRIDRLTGRIPQ